MFGCLGRFRLLENVYKVVWDCFKLFQVVSRHVACVGSLRFFKLSWIVDVGLCGCPNVCVDFSSF